MVTDYYNTIMPLIRYDTGDIGCLDYINIIGKKTLVLKNIEGRKLDLIYNTKCKLISSYIVYKNMWKYNEISQYQFIQMLEKKYVFRICSTNKFNRENELINEMLTKKTTKSKEAWEVVMKKVYCNQILRTI